MHVQYHTSNFMCCTCHYYTFSVYIAVCKMPPDVLLGPPAMSSPIQFHWNSQTFQTFFHCIYKGVSKSSRTVLVKRSLLNLDVKFLHHLQSTPLLREYSGPSVSAMLGSIPGSPFLELCQVPAAIPLASLQWCRIFDPSSEASAWGRGKSHRGPHRVSLGDHCYVVLGQKSWNFKGPVSCHGG